MLIICFMNEKRKSWQLSETWCGVYNVEKHVLSIPSSMYGYWNFPDSKVRGANMANMFAPWTLGLYSLSGKTSYRQISWSLETARLGVIMIVSLWNLTGISAALLPRCLLNFRAIGKVKTRISRLRDFTRSCGKTSYRLVNRGPAIRDHMSDGEVITQANME